jgi:hypothetical protein
MIRGSFDSINGAFDVCQAAKICIEFHRIDELLWILRGATVD